jgi:SWI/SNF-related matrix-associated actin-dependent regulator of chromatin subfamily A member 5
MQTDDVYDRIKKDTVSTGFSRVDHPQELHGRCNALLGMIENEAELKRQEEAKAKSSKGKAGGSY